MKATGTALNRMTAEQIQATNKIVDIIFTEMRRMFPAWHVNPEGLNPEQVADRYKASLRDRLVLAGVDSMEDITDGLRKLRQMSENGQEFLPSVYQVVNLCKPSDTSHRTFTDAPKLPAPPEAKERSRQIAKWYTDRNAEIEKATQEAAQLNKGRSKDKLVKPDLLKWVKYDTPQPWEGPIETDYRPGDERLRHQCLKKGIPYFHPNGEVHMPDGAVLHRR